MGFKNILFLLLSTPIFLNAQQNVSLRDALHFVENNYPALRAKFAEAESAKENIRLAKSTLIPALDLSYQFNYSTYNNVTGMFYPQGLLPISGPPSSDNTYNGVIGSAGSVYLNWQPVTFGQRGAQIKLARADASNRNYDLQNEIFKHQINLIGSYLDMLLATELLKVFEENITRSNYDAELSRSLALSGMRPGVDTALFESEASNAKIELLNAQRSASVLQIVLSQLTGTDSIKILADTVFFRRLPTGDEPGRDNTAHPYYRVLLSQLDYEKAKLKAIKFDVVPKLNLWGIAYARGSGAGYNSSTEASQGFTFSRYNYGTGVQLTMPILHFAEVMMRSKQQNFILQAAGEKLKQVDLDLRKQQEISDTIYYSSLLLVKEATIRLSSAEYAFEAMQNRYRAGLANYTDFVQAQYNLVKSETELKRSYWQVWKGLLNGAAAKGDLNIFINHLQ